MKSRCARPSSRRAAAVALAAALLAGAAAAQQPAVPATPLDRGSVLSPILTIDSERVFLESDFGKRIAAEAEAEATALEAENTAIAADLEAEEKALTARRAGMTPEEFRLLADAFDDKVQRTRSAQAAKGRAINDALERQRDVFLQAAAPVLEQLLRESGAAVILERRSVFVSASAIEITEEAIALLNARLGDGE